MRSADAIYDIERRCKTSIEECNNQECEGREVEEVREEVNNVENVVEKNADLKGK